MILSRTLSVQDPDISVHWQGRYFCTNHLEREDRFSLVAALTDEAPRLTELALFHVLQPFANYRSEQFGMFAIFKYSDFLHYYKQKNLLH